MDFLKPLFDEELNSEKDDIEIVGIVFDRSRILEVLDHEAYKNAFNDWLNGWQGQLLDKANEILELHDNKGRFEQLTRTLRAGNLVPFVGAGLSIPSGYPSWTKFLYQCCNESSISEEDLKALLDDGCYEEAAQSLYDDLTAPVFNELLETTFGKDNLIQGAVNYLPFLFNDKHIITTNFDCVIEKVYSNQGVPFDGGAIKSGKSLTEVVRCLMTTPRLLIKLHGKCELVTERVLLKQEYDAAYHNTGNVSTFFDRAIFHNSLLFLGASLNIDRTILAMERIAGEKGHDMLPRHYAFLELKDTDDRAERKRFLGRANIFPIWYPEGEHDESLEALLFKLIKDNE